jgi:hypothetical protein
LHKKGATLFRIFRKDRAREKSEKDANEWRTDKFVPREISNKTETTINGCASRRYPFTLRESRLKNPDSLASMTATFSNYNNNIWDILYPSEDKRESNNEGVTSGAKSQNAADVATYTGWKKNMLKFLGNPCEDFADLRQRAVCTDPRDHLAIREDKAKKKKK